LGHYHSRAKNYFNNLQLGLNMSDKIPQSKADLSKNHRQYRQFMTANLVK
jgi:hypothetical protein